MYTIIMDEDKQLVQTEVTALYKGENLVDKIRFLLPLTYNETPLSEFSVVAQYTNEHLEIIDEPMPFTGEKYRDYKYVYHLPVDTDLTKESGVVYLTLAFKKDDNVVLRSSGVFLSIINPDDEVPSIPVDPDIAKEQVVRVDVVQNLTEEEKERARNNIGAGDGAGNSSLDIDALKSWINNRISDSTADWHENDKNADNYVKNKTHYDTRKLVTTQEFTVDDTAGVWSYIKIADTIDFDINSIQYMSRDGSDGYSFTDMPVQISLSDGAHDIYSPIADMWFGVYFSNQDEADAWYGGDNNPFVPGLYLWANVAEGEDVRVTCSFTYAADGELKKLDEKYIPDELLMGIVEVYKGVDEAFNRINDLRDNTDHRISEIKTDLNTKMDKTNPSGTGSFSINRQSDSVIGDGSVALGEGAVANRANMTALGVYNKANDADFYLKRNGGAITGLSFGQTIYVK